jgi:hypothetical protein
MAVSRVTASAMMLSEIYPVSESDYIRLFSQLEATRKSVTHGDRSLAAIISLSDDAAASAQAPTRTRRLTGGPGGFPNLKSSFHRDRLTTTVTPACLSLATSETQAPSPSNLNTASESLA